VARAFEDSSWKPDVANGGTYCRRCGDSVGPGEATDVGCGTCREGADLAGGIGDGFIRLGTYVDPLRRWVRANKYQRWNEMGFALGQLLGQQLLPCGLVEPHATIIVPMPMPWIRRMYRGTDHARDIASGVRAIVRAPVMQMLSRGNGPPQVSLTPSERRRAGSRRLRIRRRLGGWHLTDVDLVLVDDVRTTGASLRAAVRLLRTLKPRRIICAVVAVSDSTARRARGHVAAPENPAMAPSG
jgi:predicted amidophosphoribosyltransferase